MNGTEERLAYSVPEVARLLGIAVGTAWARVRDGSIPSVKLGGRVLVPRKGIEMLLSQTKGPA